MRYIERNRARHGSAEANLLVGWGPVESSQPVRQQAISLLPRDNWQQEAAERLENTLYPGLSALTSRQQELESELRKLQADWDHALDTQHENENDPLLADNWRLQQARQLGQIVASAAQDVIRRLDCLQVELMGIKARSRSRLQAC